MTNLTWEELCEWVKENPQYNLIMSDDKKEIGYYGICVSMDFFDNGEVAADGGLLVKNRTPSQIKTIIENLFGNENA